MPPSRTARESVRGSAEVGRELGVIQLRQQDEREHQGAFGAGCGEYTRLPGIASCEFYRCRERNAPRRGGPEGYYLGYGLKYCERFTRDVRPKLTKPGKVWVDTTRVCLMRFVDEHIPVGTPCDQVRDAAFRSHAHCYLTHGVCSLSPHDWSQILAAIDDWALREALLMGLGCVGEWARSAAHGLTRIAVGLAHVGTRTGQDGWTRLRASVSVGADTGIAPPRDRLWRKPASLIE